MKRFKWLGFIVALALAAPSMALANSVGVGPCSLRADNVSYAGSIGTFKGGIVSYCDNVGSSFPMNVTVCFQRNGGAGWANMDCANSGKHSVPNTYYVAKYAINCGVWHRVYAWAQVWWLYLTWKTDTGQVYGNASLRC